MWETSQLLSLRYISLAQKGRGVRFVPVGAEAYSIRPLSKRKASRIVKATGNVLWSDLLKNLQGQPWLAGATAGCAP